MDQRIVVILIATIIAFSGCATVIENDNNSDQNNTNPDSNNGVPGDGIPPVLVFSYGVPFTVHKGDAYTNNQGTWTAVPDKFILVAESFTDSRCPEGVQCIWEGELGVTLNVSAKDEFGREWHDTVYLGSSRAKEKEFAGFLIKLESITESSATLTVSKKADGTTEKVWFSYEPKQCGTNPWETWELGKTKEFANENAKISAWLLDEYQISVYGYASKPLEPGMMVCMSCSCSRGDTIAVLVYSSDSVKMESLGWTQIGKGGAIACTMDAKTCPDGSAVGRTEPFCEFAACPTVTACTEEAKICPDGTAVGRNPPTCEFSACPTDLTDANIEIVKVDAPGYVMNPTTVTTTITTDGNYTIQTTSRSYNNDTNSWDVNESTKSGTISRLELESIAKLAITNGFYDITEEDTAMCITDLPTQQVQISINSHAFEVFGLGTECDKQKTKAAYAIIDKIELAVKS